MIKAKINGELDKIVDISKDYGAKKVLLFGSYLEDTKKARDIDIAVTGIPPRNFFKYYGDVSMAVKDEVDIVDLDEIDKHFYNRIVTKGKVLYERKS